MTPFVPKQRIAVQNDSGEFIPPRSIVVVTSVSFDDVADGQEKVVTTHVDQYGCGRPGNVMVTGPNIIPPDAGGNAYFDNFLYVAIDETIDPPVPGEEWGPSDDSWVITRGGKGFWPQGDQNPGATDEAMFLRTFLRDPPSVCSSSSSSASSNSSSSSSSGSHSSSGPCGCVTVVTSVSCGSGGLTVTYGTAKGCC